MASDLPSVLQVPDQPRRFRLRGYQWAGLAVMLSFPVLALFGVFGEAWSEGVAAGREVSLRVEYPSTYRYKQINSIQVYALNRSNTAIDTLEVAFDRAFMTRFSTLNMIPSSTRAFVVELTDVAPAEERLVWAELQAERYGSHTGSVRAYRKGGTDTISVPLRTFVFP